VINALREWKLVCPNGALGLVFPTGNGQVESHANIARRGLSPILVAGGMTMPEPVLAESGKPTINNAGELVMRDAPRYGMHSLRHACAALWIENGMNPKRI
jgi:hypothetical protein